MQASSVVRASPKSSFIVYSIGRLPLIGSLRSSVSGETSFTSGGVSFTIVMDADSIWFEKPLESQTRELQPPSSPRFSSKEKSIRPSDSTPGTTTSPGSVSAPFTSGRDGFTDTVIFDPSRPTIEAEFV